MRISRRQLDASSSGKLTDTGAEVATGTRKEAGDTNSNGADVGTERAFVSLHVRAAPVGDAAGLSASMRTSDSRKVVLHTCRKSHRRYSVAIGRRSSKMGNSSVPGPVASAYKSTCECDLIRIEWCAGHSFQACGRNVQPLNTRTVARPRSVSFLSMFGSHTSMTNSLLGSRWGVWVE